MIDDPIDRVSLPDWPRLMSIEYAALYLSLSKTTVRSLGIAALRVGRRVLYDRRDLDAWADDLGGKSAASDWGAQSAEVERRFLGRRAEKRAQQSS